MQQRINMGAMSLALPAWDMLRVIAKSAGTLLAVVRVELAKRYSGSLFGKLWVVLYPALLLSIYLFVYLVIFQMRFPGYSEWDYVLYVFCGLVPFMGFMEAVTSGCLSIKQNMHLIRNVMLPIELIPVRYVLVSMAGQLVSMAMLLGLIAWNGALSLKLVALPVILVLQVLWLVGLLWILAPLTVALPDVSYFVGLFVLFLLFISPIGFKPDMVPPPWDWVVALNPVYYLADAFRATMLSLHAPQAWTLLIYTVMCVGTFVAGGSFFRRFKSVLADYE